MTESDSEENYYEDDDNDDIVIDPGSYTIKAGYSGDDSPRAVFASCTGRPVHTGVCHYSMAPPDTYVGDEAFYKSGILKMNWPIHEKSIRHFYDFETVLHHTFDNELRIAPEEHKIFITETPNASQKQKENVCKIMFESFNVNSYFSSNQQCLALFANGQTNGIVLDIGYDSTFSVPIHEGNVFQKGIVNTNYGAEQITSNLLSLHKVLNEKTMYDLNDIKHKLLYCNLYTLDESNALIAGFIKQYNIKLPNVLKVLCFDYFNDFQLQLNSQNFKLPDDNLININIEQTTNPTEILFNPNLFENTDVYQSRIRHKYFINDGYVARGCYKSPYLCDDKYEIDKMSIVELLNESIEICEKNHLENDVIENVYLCGGSSRINGVGNRIQREINNYKFKRDTNVKIIAPKEEYIVWIGGSIISSLSTFQEQWLTKDEYDEIGTDIIVRLH